MLLDTPSSPVSSNMNEDKRRSSSVNQTENQTSKYNVYLFTVRLKLILKH
jgi:hypothetical protein